MHVHFVCATSKLLESLVQRVNRNAFIVKLAPEKCSNHGHKYVWWAPSIHTIYRISSHSIVLMMHALTLWAKHSKKKSRTITQLQYEILAAIAAAAAAADALAWMHTDILNKQQVPEKWRGKNGNILYNIYFDGSKNNGHKFSVPPKNFIATATNKNETTNALYHTRIASHRIWIDHADRTTPKTR